MIDCTLCAGDLVKCVPGDAFKSDSEAKNIFGILVAALKNSTPKNGSGKCRKEKIYIPMN